MAEIIKVYKQAMQKTKFIGKSYKEEDKQNGVKRVFFYTLTPNEVT